MLGICVGDVCTGGYLFQAYAHVTNMDPTRLGAQVVSGIGVLCAGAIMKEDASTITGLTTAAGLWCSACIGLAAGSGSIISAAWTTVLMLLVLRVLRYLEKRSGRK